MKAQQQLHQKGSGFWDIDTHITFGHNIPGPARPLLSWQVKDQSKFFGILNCLNNLNLPFLELIFITEEGENLV